MNTFANYHYRIYGDNILECENFLDWLNSFESNFKFIKEIGSIDRPILLYVDKETNKNFTFQLCPVYGNKDNPIWTDMKIFEYFTEKIDVYITKIDSDGKESKPIAVIEFDDALQAGNQSWQRSRRSVDSAKNKIPYFYVLPILGMERSSDGKKLKNLRYQNASITIGQLSLSSSFNTPSLQIYKNTPWYDYAKKINKPIPNNFLNYHGISSAIKLMMYYIRSSAYENSKLTPPIIELEDIISGMFDVSEIYTKHLHTNLSIYKDHTAIQKSHRKHAVSILAKNLLSLSAKSNNYRLDEIDENDFYSNGSLYYKNVQMKTTSSRFLTLMNKINWIEHVTDIDKIQWLKNWNVVQHDKMNPTILAKQNFRKIPVTYKEGKSEAALINNRAHLYDIIKTLYPDIGNNVLNWIYDGTTKPAIFFIPLYGYKPTGDSRPDRGLIPALFSQFPRLVTKENTMVVIYSKYVPNNWIDILQKQQNQLWTAISEYCGMVIVDKTQTGLILNGH